MGSCIWDGQQVGVLNQHIYKIHPKVELNLKWLYALLQIITARIEKNAHGFKANLVHVRKSDITSQIAGFSTFIEQQKIADILNTWDKAIRLTQELIAAKEQRKKGLMQQLLTGQVRFPKFVLEQYDIVEHKSSARLDWKTLEFGGFAERVKQSFDPPKKHRGTKMHSVWSTYHKGQGKSWAIQPL